MIVILFSSIILAYVLLIILFWLGWEKTQPCVGDSECDHVAISIVIAVRNESENIIGLLQDIERQSYNKEKIELVIVDDHSTDDTVNKIQDYLRSSTYIIQLEEQHENEGKKAAIKYGIGISHHEIIFTTDGDCRLPAFWLSSMMACFDNDHIKLVSGPVRLMPQNTFLQRLQAIEFSSLISSGAATIAFGRPAMANAANMAFKKKSYDQVVERLHDDISSGDDVFLLHEIHQQYKKSVVFCRNPKATVDTQAAATLSEFFNQRKRWSSKWQFYHDWPTKLLAAFIFMVNAAMVVLPFLLFLGVIDWVIAANLFVLKLIFEFWFLKEVQKFFKSKFLLHEFIILAIIYPVYVTMIAVAGLFGNYIWKGRVTK